MSRRSSLPPVPTPGGTLHGARRAGGPRREASERVQIRNASFATNGWTLNISRGGARLVLEEGVELGGDYSVEFGTDGGDPREVRVVWVQDEADGQIVGVQFLDGSGSIPPASAPRSAPPSEDPA